MSTRKTFRGGKTQHTKIQFPIQKDVCYRSMQRGRISVAGIGKTLQISSAVVHFTTDAPLKQGEQVLLAVDWPAMLDNAHMMKLEIWGSVISSSPGAAAIKIGRYEFRTRGTALKVVHSGQLS